MADSLSTNLPLQLTRFIGRQREIAEVKRLLATTRLLTLTGAGGCGKTRLALQVAADLLDSFPDGVWFVDLAPLSDSTLVPQTAATVFELQESSTTSPSELLKNHLRPTNLLLVLDNCEHLIQACAELSDMLLRACPNLKILATSREALNIAGETTYRVPSLAVPDPRHLPPIESLSQYEAVRLFIDRATSIQTTFSVNTHNAHAVAQICFRLDGIPLALELAAARIKIFSAEEIEARLDDRFRLLTSENHTALARQQTIRSTIDWSFALLSEPESTLLLRLSVFAGGWAFDAAESVCADAIPPTPLSKGGLEGNEILDLLSHLIDKSLVLAGESNGVTRYRMLETIRQYAREKLDKSGETAAVQNRHLDFFLKFAEHEKPLWGSAPQESFDRLETEHNNVRAGLIWSFESKNLEAGLRLAGTMWWFWHLRGHFNEGSDWLRRVLDLARIHDAPSWARAYALQAAEGLAWRQGNVEWAISLSEESLALCGELGNKEGMAFSYGTLGMVAWLRGNYAQARNFHEQALTIRREIDSPVQAAFSLCNLSLVAWAERSYEQAGTLCEEALQVHRERGPQWHLANSLATRGTVARAQGDFSLARSVFLESLTIQRKLGDKLNIAYALEGLACVSAVLGQPRQAASLWGAAEALRESINAPIPPAYRDDYAVIIAHARAELGIKFFDGAWNEGRAMTIEQAMEYSLQQNSLTEDSPLKPPAFSAGLTEREVEVLRLLARGLSNQSIADKLVLSRRTVHAHLRSIYGKLDVTTRGAATHAAIVNKIV